MDESHGDLCDHPDHPDNKNKGARDPITAQCTRRLCPLLRLDAVRSSVMDSGHFVMFRGWNPDDVCPHHGKVAILSEPIDEAGVQRRYCIDCIAHALYDRSIQKRVDVAIQSIMGIRAKQDPACMFLTGAVGLLEYLVSGDLEKIRDPTLKHEVERRESS